MLKFLLTTKNLPRLPPFELLHQRGAALLHLLLEIAVGDTGPGEVIPSSLSGAEARKSI